MSLLLYFLFHDLDLELSIPLFSFWFKNLVVLVVFVIVTLTYFPQTYGLLTKYVKAIWST
jgi:hypothetical protein